MHVYYLKVINNKAAVERTPAMIRAWPTMVRPRGQLTFTRLLSLMLLAAGSVLALPTASTATSANAGTASTTSPSVVAGTGIASWRATAASTATRTKPSIPPVGGCCTNRSA